MKKYLVGGVLLALAQACGTEPAPQLTFQQEAEDPNVQVECLSGIDGLCGSTLDLPEVPAPSVNLPGVEIEPVERFDDLLQGSEGPILNVNVRDPIHDKPLGESTDFGVESNLKWDEIAASVLAGQYSDSVERVDNPLASEALDLGSELKHDYENPNIPNIDDLRLDDE